MEGGTVSVDAIPFHGYLPESWMDKISVGVDKIIRIILSREGL